MGLVYRLHMTIAETDLNSENVLAVEGKLPGSRQDFASAFGRSNDLRKK